MGINRKSPLLEKGDVLNGKWEIREHIATGGMAEVYRVRGLKENTLGRHSGEWVSGPR